VSPPTRITVDPAVGKLLTLEEIIRSRHLGRDILLYLNEHVQHDHAVRQITYDNEALTIDILTPDPNTTYLAGIYSVEGFTRAAIADGPDKESKEAEFNRYTIRFWMTRARPHSSDASDVPTKVGGDRMDRLLAQLPAPSTLAELCARIKTVAAESPFKLDAFEQQPARLGAPDDPYVIAGVDVRATVSFSELLSFVRHVGDLPYPIGLSAMNLKSVSETESRIAVALRFSIPMAATGSSAVPQTSTRTAIPETLRDLFRSSFRSEFARNLSIDGIRVTAITEEPDGYVAQVEDSRGGRYLLRRGDRLENGSVATISLDQIAFDRGTRGKYIVRLR
jgi:hypothetical protein